MEVWSILLHVTVGTGALVTGLISLINADKRVINYSGDPEDKDAANNVDVDESADQGKYSRRWFFLFIALANLTRVIEEVFALYLDRFWIPFSGTVDEGLPTYMTVINSIVQTLPSIIYVTVFSFFAGYLIQLHYGSTGYSCFHLHTMLLASNGVVYFYVFLRILMTSHDNDDRGTVSFLSFINVVVMVLTLYFGSAVLSFLSSIPNSQHADRIRGKLWPLIGVASLSLGVRSLYYFLVACDLLNQSTNHPLNDTEFIIDISTVCITELIPSISVIVLFRGDKGCCRLTAPLPVSNTTAGSSTGHTSSSSNNGSSYRMRASTPPTSSSTSATTPITPTSLSSTSASNAFSQFAVNSGIQLQKFFPSSSSSYQPIPDSA